MLINPVKVSFNGFAILFKIISVYCALLLAIPFFQLEKYLLELLRWMKKWVKNFFLHNFWHFSQIALGGYFDFKKSYGMHIDF